MNASFGVFVRSSVPAWVLPGLREDKLGGRQDTVDFSDGSDLPAEAGQGLGVGEVVLFGLALVQPLVRIRVARLLVS